MSSAEDETPPKFPQVSSPAPCSVTEPAVRPGSLRNLPDTCIAAFSHCVCCKESEIFESQVFPSAVCQVLVPKFVGAFETQTEGPCILRTFMDFNFSGANR